jgi:hypothetical protein
VCNPEFQFSTGDEGHNAGSIIRISFHHVVKDVRMYHLHQFRENALSRVNNGIWRGGGDGGGFVIKDHQFDLERTDFLKLLYSTLEIKERPVCEACEVNTYVGLQEKIKIEE